MLTMFWYEKTLPTPLENLALDEALLEHAETASANHPTIQPTAWESLRFWEIPDTCVIMGVLLDLKSRSEFGLDQTRWRSLFETSQRRIDHCGRPRLHDV